MKNCLEINSDFGNNIENLSHNFEKIFSLDNNNNNLTIQLKRFNFTKRNNIILLNADYQNLPFKNNYFDMIVFNNFELNFLKKINKNDQRIILSEIKRVLKDDGIFHFSEISYNQIKKIKKLLEECGFNSKIYWSYPSGNISYYSGILGSEIPIKWLFHNLDKFLLVQNSIKNKFLKYILKNFSSEFIIKLFLKNFCSFIFICNNENYENYSIEKNITNNFNSSFLTISRRLKILYIIFGIKDIPDKIVKIKKFNYESINEITNPAIKNYKNIFYDDDRISIEKWHSGRIINLKNSKEIILVLKKIFQTQLSSSNQEISASDLEYEIKEIYDFFKNEVSETTSYVELLNEYRKYIMNKSLPKTILHGDLSIQNILFDPINDSINIIDWETSSEFGNPISDIATFIFRTFVFNKQESLENFRKKIYGQDKVFNYNIKLIKSEFEKFFKFKLDIILIIKIQILKDIMIKKNRNSNYKINLKLLEILDNTRVTKINWMD